MWGDNDYAAKKVVQVDNDATRERHYHEAQQYLASIVDSADDAIIGKTLDGIITSWNRSAELIFGYTAEEVIGKPITILFHPTGWMKKPRLLKRSDMASVSNITRRFVAVRTEQVFRYL